ncbi:PI-actitoxin-Afv2a-like [Condylostylus longicornis]|uniref:PI-actitoxin-Afv2a-like n=1 Tax=Condylostylus longicornis TaxID=2530218 RepID=UPI00244E12CB|nr:PI-actitoxin-Afv2a-like [Condylostylus longicornis]
MKLIFSLMVLLLSVVLISADPPENCLLEHTVGYGRASIPRFYYSAEKQDCISFKWGGAENGSNGNRFETYDKCIAECKV